jgi:hypothetical protein
METRLGDIIDDFCIKCKRIMNHAVVSILDGKPAKVRCRTCYNDHDYRFELAPPPKVDPRKLALLAEKAAAAAAASNTAPVEEVEPEIPLAEEVPVVIEEPIAIEKETAPKTKAKARGRK